LHQGSSGADVPRLAYGRWSTTLVLLATAFVVTSCGGGEDEPERRQISIAGLRDVPVRTVVERVEKLRGLRFRELPEIEVVDEKRLGRELEKVARAAVRADPDVAEREERSAAAAEALLLLSGVVDSGSEVSLLKSGEEEIGGAYVDKQDKLYLVREAIRRDRKLTENVLAHELVHALEDQHFKLFERSTDLLSDSSAAAHALIEGSATVAEASYGSRYLRKGRSPQALLDRRFRRLQDTKVPPGIRPAAGFPYIAGSKFATTLLKRGGWATVSRADQHPPQSTEQVLHPEKFIRREKPKAVAIAPGDALPSEWRRLGGGDLGELTTRMVLSAGLPARRANRATNGWGGGAFKVWYLRRLPTIRCGQRCRERATAVLAWDWDDAAGAAAFRQALRAYVKGGLGGAATRRNTWRFRDGAGALAGRARRTALAFAPDERLAGRLAARAVEAAQEHSTTEGGQ
jgi:hypothetical protein